MNEEPEYEVGYGKPPKHTQWKPGESGNKKGRPNSRKPVEDIWKEVLEEQMVVNGKKMSLKEVLIRSLVKDAIKGKSHARATVMRYLEGEQVLEDFEPNLDDEIAYLKLARLMGDRPENQDEGGQEEDDGS